MTHPFSRKSYVCDRPVVVFISSPFQEPKNQHWGLRFRLYDALLANGHSPWLYEIQGRLEEGRGYAQESIILNAVCRSDLVVVLFRTRAGSYLPGEPFLATVFEIFHARRFDKHVFLYILGDFHWPRLQSVLSVFEDPLILPDGARRCGDDEDKLVSAVLADVKGLVPLPTQQAERIVREVDAFDLMHEHGWLERTYSRLSQAVHEGGFWQAGALASGIPLLTAFKADHYAKFAYASLLSLCANIRANQTSYTLAEKCSRLAVRFYMEMGYLYPMLAEIQALSGILNMAGQHLAAYHVNSYGIRQASKMLEYSPGFSDSLLLAFNDSRGSILSRLGKGESAESRIRRSFKTIEEAGPYNLAKYATALSTLGGTKNLEEGLRLIEGVALPTATQTGESLGYVLRDVGGLRISIGDFHGASALLHSAAAACQKKGQLHTLAQVRRMQAYLTLISPSYS